MTGTVLGLIGVLLALSVPLTIERLRRPRLRIERADDVNAEDPDSNFAFRLLHIRVVNEPLGRWLTRWLLRNSATGCRVQIRFVSQSDQSVVKMAGRWTATGQPLTHDNKYDANLVPQTLRFDVPADPAGEQLGIAVKIDGEDDAYGFTSASYGAPGFQLAKLRLPHQAYRVDVEARAGGITATKTFLLDNPDGRCTSFRLRER
jgi:hypothetical protein